MDVTPFALERWFADAEPDADIMLAESGVRSLAADRFDTTPETLGYVIPTAGDPAFRDTIGRHHDRSTDETVFTCGTQEANFLAFLALVETHAVVVTPTYGALTALPATLAEVTEVPLHQSDWTLDPAAVADAIRPETDIVVINNPNNPTGRYHDEATMHAIYEACAANGAYLLCDEVYRFLASDPMPPAASYGRYGISTAGVSKAFGLAGLRFGWLCGPPAVVAAATNWKDYTTISPPRIGQHIARQAYNQRDTILAENRDLATQHREIVADFLHDHGLAWSDPDVGVNAFVDIPPGFADGESFCQSVLQEESIVLAPGEAFGHPQQFRIGFGLTRDRLNEGLNRLDAFLTRHQ